MSDLAKRMRENAATCDRKDPFEACLQDDLERGADEIERLRAVLQRIADMPVDGYESTIPVRSIARVALEDDNENDDTDGTGVNTDWLRDDAGR